MTRFVLVHGAWSDGAAWDAVAVRPGRPSRALLELTA